MKPSARFFWVAVFAATLFSCSQQFHCKKCFDGKNVKRDTVRIDTTVYVPVSRVDSVFVPSPFYIAGDTIILHKDRITVRYKKLPGDTVFLSGECESDTVRIEVKVPVETSIRTGFTWVQLLLAFVAGAGILALVYVLRK